MFKSDSSETHLQHSGQHWNMQTYNWLFINLFYMKSLKALSVDCCFRYSGGTVPENCSSVEKVFLPTGKVVWLFKVEFVLFHWGWDVTRMPWDHCLMPRDCNRNWAGLFIMTTRLRPHPQPPPIGSSLWWGCRGVSKKWTSWRRPGITLTSPSVSLPPLRLRLTQTTGPSHMISHTHRPISPTHRLMHCGRVSTGHTLSCCHYCGPWFGSRGRQEKTNGSGRSFCDPWRSSGRGSTISQPSKSFWSNTTCRRTKGRARTTHTSLSFYSCDDARWINVFPKPITDKCLTPTLITTLKVGTHIKTVKLMMDVIRLCWLFGSSWTGSVSFWVIQGWQPAEKIIRAWQRWLMASKGSMALYKNLSKGDIQ